MARATSMSSPGTISPMAPRRFSPRCVGVTRGSTNGPEGYWRLSYERATSEEGADRSQPPQITYAVGVSAEEYTISEFFARPRRGWNANE